jgi:(2Fe-2S) ferredoxin
MVYSLNRESDSVQKDPFPDAWGVLLAGENPHEVDVTEKSAALIVLPCQMCGHNCVGSIPNSRSLAKARSHSGWARLRSEEQCGFFHIFNRCLHHRLAPRYVWLNDLNFTEPPCLAMPTPPSSRHRWLVRVCQNRSCLRNGAREVLDAFRQHQSKQILVTESDCMGQCSVGPTVRVMPDDTWYCHLHATDVPVIVEQHLQGGVPVRSHLHPRFHPPEN